MHTYREGDRGRVKDFNGIETDIYWNMTIVKYVRVLRKTDASYCYGYIR